MNRSSTFLTTVVSLFLLYPVTALARDDENHYAGSRTVTLLFTNDVESAYDPISAFWIDGMSRIGGIAEMTTLIRELRETEPNVFLFDSGDIFTGALAKLTQGQLAFELMITMGYDAMAIGNLSAIKIDKKSNNASPTNQSRKSDLGASFRRDSGSHKRNRPSLNQVRAIGGSPRDSR